MARKTVIAQDWHFQLAPEMISVPRQPVRSAAELAAVGRASVAAAWRLFSALKDGGHLDDSGSLAMVRDLMGRWRAAAQRPQRRVGARSVLPGARSDRAIA